MRKFHSKLALSLIFILITSCAIFSEAWVFGASLDIAIGQERIDQIIREAANAVDEAWEEFHQSAIGGTLASPAIQGHIEQQLHQARNLLMEARKANRANDYSSVRAITEKVFALTEHIVQNSLEKKR